jgi:ankyrin repeat protein
MSKRSLYIENPFKNTCEWLHRPETGYDSWLSSDWGIFCIEGKTGTGKSTLMKYAAKQARKQLGFSAIIITHFFSAQGVQPLTRTSAGLYRSILYQLTGSSTEFFRSIQGSNPTMMGPSSKKSSWSVTDLKLLKEMLVEAITNSKSRHSVTIFIDGLDECDKDTAQDIVKNMEDLMDSAESLNRPFKVCIAARPYPPLIFDRPGRKSIDMVDFNGTDIELYVNSKLLRFDKVGHPRRYDGIRYELITRAAGTFLWAVEMVEMLNNAYSEDGVKKPQRLLARLHKVPNKLEEVFKAKFKHLIENLSKDQKGHEQELLKIMQWMVYAARPLTLREFRYALEFMAPAAWGSQQEFESSNVFIEGSSELATRIRNRTGGLIEVKKHKSSKILPPPVLQSRRTISMEIDRILSPKPIMNRENTELLGSNSYHSSLAQQAKLMGAPDIPELSSDTDKFDSSDNSDPPSDADSDDSGYDSVSYAVDTDWAERLGGKQTVEFYHWPAKECFTKWGLGLFDNRLTFQVCHGNLHRSCLSYLKVRELRSPLPSTPTQKADGQPPRPRIFRRFPFLRYAIHFWTKHAELAEEVVPSRPSLGDIGLSGSSGDLLAMWSDNMNGDVAGEERLETDALSFLLHIPALKNMPTCLDHLLQLGADPNASSIVNPLLMAVEHEHVEIVERIIHARANPNVQDSQGRTPLIISTLRGNPTILNRLLDVPHIDIDHRDDEGKTALMHSFIESSDLIIAVEMARSLIDRGANYGKTDKLGRSAIHYASMRKEDSFIEVFDGRNVDPNVQDVNLDTPLHLAIRSGNRKAFQFLLDAGTRISLKNKDGETILNALLQSLQFLPEELPALVRSLLGSKDLPEIQTLLSDSDRHGNNAFHSLFRKRISQGCAQSILEVLLPAGLIVESILLAKNAINQTPIDLIERRSRIFYFTGKTHMPHMQLLRKVTEAAGTSHQLLVDRPTDRD